MEDTGTLLRSYCCAKGRDIDTWNRGDRNGHKQRVGEK